MPGNATSWSRTADGQIAVVTRFEIDQINALRAEAATATGASADGPEGWARSDADPMKLLAVFDTLRIKSGFVLRAYQYRADGNGNGVVWAMPQDAGWPSVDECASVQDGFLNAPRPAGAIDQFMDAIEGDGTAWSFICASLFAREAWELGARWHGVSWAVETIFGADPWRERPQTEMGELDGAPEEWTWLDSAPDDWAPTVEQGADQTTVTFFSFYPVATQTLARNVDTFGSESLAFTPHRDEIAAGPAGAIF